ncbi:MAG: hypothetical protein J5525_00385 [Lachnospiraceae bacterium]|nr:hypothetical protein [Lachnospiraceae bacterium]
MSNRNKKRISIVSTMHYIRLVYRSVLFILLLIAYIRFRLYSDASIIESAEKMPTIIYVTWLVFVIEMILRFFPSKYESPGCQKQFACNYIKSGSTDISIPDNNSTVLIALIWVVFNAAFGALHMEGILDDGIMVLLCSAYSICDVICILFFCPFQTWFMKNKCCSTCRIYNWDYAMMFTPLFFVRKSYTWSLLILSVALLLRWEITFYLHPERFSEKTNDYLQCKNCTEKLCGHKKQLISLWKQIEEYSADRIKKLKK